MTQVARFADEAVYYFQYPTRQAINYVVKNASVDVATATKAVRETLTFGKTTKRK
jgi:hypothetical protein